MIFNNRYSLSADIDMKMAYEIGKYFLVVYVSSFTNICFGSNCSFNFKILNLFLQFWI